jgi:hypothetical protein
VFLNNKPVDKKDTDNRFDDLIYVYELDLSKAGDNTFGNSTEVNDYDK